MSEMSLSTTNKDTEWQWVWKQTASRQKSPSNQIVIGKLFWGNSIENSTVNIFWVRFATMPFKKNSLLEKILTDDTRFVQTNGILCAYFHF